jgi:hypothetical protein
VSPEIHGAMVGGAIGGATVVLGVVLAELLQRRSRRREAFEELILEVGARLPRLVVDASALRQGPPPPDWNHSFEYVHDLLIRCRRGAHGFRRSREVAAAVDDLIVRVTVLLGAHLATGRLVAKDELLELTTRSIVELTHRASERGLDDDITAYMERKRIERIR